MKLEAYAFVILIITLFIRFSKPLNASCGSSVSKLGPNRAIATAVKVSSSCPKDVNVWGEISPSRDQ